MTENIYRPRYHITAPTGRLNDPNGLFLSGNTFHVFYQKDPAFPFGVKRTGWGHVATELVEGEAVASGMQQGMKSFTTWRHYPDALYPDASYDAHGCYSGGSVRDKEGNLYLFYTGNLKEKHSDGSFTRHATQNRVIVQSPDSQLGGVYRRDVANPVIPAPEEGYTAHYRDPMITRDSDERWRMVLGAQRSNETGAVVMYYSEDLRHWDFAGEITFDTGNAQPGLSPDIVPSGYMWECPNLLRMRDMEDGKDYDVLIFCPQGLDPVCVDGVTHYASSDQCGYVVGHMRGTHFEVVRGFSELDYGHTFYAPQIIADSFADATASSAARSALMLGWMGLPAQDEHPSLEAEGWVHCLTLPRRVTLRGGCLYQEVLLPKAEEDDSYYIIDENIDSLSREWRIPVPGGREVHISYVPEEGGMRGCLMVEIAGDQRVIPVRAGAMRIVVDASAVEIFAGDGSIACALLV